MAAVVLGLAFAVSIVNPKKYQKAAEKVLEHDEGSRAPTSRSSAADYFDAFLHLEKTIRDYLRAHDLYVPSRGAPKMSYSFRQMIDALRQNEIIDRALLNELLELNRYRNLVFHGHLDKADASMVQRAREAAIGFENVAARRTDGDS